MPARRDGDTDFSWVESQMVASWDLEGTTLVMNSIEGVYRITEEELDQHWQETYQLIFGFDWDGGEVEIDYYDPEDPDADPEDIELFCRKYC